MKKTVRNTFITAAALAVVVSAYSTLPEGRAMSEEEKLTFRGLDANVLACRQCIHGGNSCAAQGTIRIGQLCTTPNLEVMTCDGLPGLIPGESKFLDVWQHGERDCDVNVLRCTLVPNTNPEIYKWSWITAGRDDYCLTVSYCEHRGTSTPTKCNPPPPGE